MVLGSKAETAGEVFQVQEDQPVPWIGRGCIGRRERRTGSSPKRQRECAEQCANAGKAQQLHPTEPSGWALG